MSKFALAKVSLFQNLTKTELALVGDFLITKKYHRGDKILKRNTTRDKIIIIVKGLVAIKNDVDKKQIVALFKQDESLGEMSLIVKGSKHQYDTEATTDLNTLELSVYNWYSIVKKQPKLANKIYTNVANVLNDRLNHANNKLVGLFTTGKIIATYDHINVIADHILDIILKIIPSSKAMFATYSPISKKVNVHKTIGYKGIKEYYNLDDDSLLKNIVAEPRTVFINQEEKQTKYGNLPYIAKTLIVVPLLTQRSITGFIILGDKENGHNFSYNNQILLETIGRQTAPAIKQISLNKIESAKADLENIYIDPFAKY